MAVAELKSKKWGEVENVRNGNTLTNMMEKLFQCGLVLSRVCKLKFWWVKKKYCSIKTNRTNLSIRLYFLMQNRIPHY